jgi:hypothetical protein
MDRKLKATIALGVIALASLAARGADTAPVAATQPTPIFSQVSVDETLTFWGKSNVNTVAELDSTVKGKLFDMAGWHITVPVYSQDVTGYGAIDLGLDLNVLKTEFVGATTNVYLEGGAWMPTGSANFGTDNVNPHVGVNWDMTWGAVVYTQTFDYLWVGSYAYSPVFGTFNDYGINAESFVAYKWSTLSVGADLNQWYTSGSNVAFLGPKAEWNVANNVNLNAGCGFAVWQDVAPANENTWNVTLGLGIKF